MKSSAFLSTMRVTIHVVLEKREYARLLSAHGSHGATGYVSACTGLGWGARKVSSFVVALTTGGISTK